MKGLVRTLVTSLSISLLLQACTARTPAPTPMPLPPTDTPIPPTEIPTPTPYLPELTDPLGNPMVLIPAGDFLMGRELGSIDELPLHQVALSAFYLDVFEVTNARFAAFLNIMGNQEEGGVTWLAVQDWVDLIQVEGVWQPVDGLADHPVTGVSWYGARAYCTWRAARLPTEAEWEKAGRGLLRGKLYPWGDEPPVCYIMTPNGAQFGDCEGDTAPVGSFGSNGYGLHDMAGNAWEWVNDWYAEGQAYYAQSPPTDPDGPASGTAHILRGGAWDAAPEALQVGYRYFADPATHIDLIGFRCANFP